ncbi:hypothetical protein HMPREF9374_3900 [Desmospora sp. 8437]|nr:hypothetical protein HMPREF9374_3900 [Desmospora sp. 8437]
MKEGWESDAFVHRSANGFWLIREKSAHFQVYGQPFAERRKPIRHHPG